MKKIVLVFDGDDTLWMNEWQYSKAMADFFSYLYSEFRDMMPNFNAVKQRFDEIDRKLFAQWGIRRGRVYMIMKEVYHELLIYFEKKFGKDCLPSEDKKIEHEKKVYEIGDQPFHFRELRWFEPAKMALEDLSFRDNYTLCLLTCYDENVWVEKSRFLGVNKYFNSVLAVFNRKTKEDFIKVSGYKDYDNSNMIFYAIGNGHSDILPALEISDKWYGIYIPHTSTSPIFHGDRGNNQYTPQPIDHPRVLTLSSIGELEHFDFEHFKPTQKSV